MTDDDAVALTLIVAYQDMSIRIIESLSTVD
jgi:hypothetical protein